MMQHDDGQPVSDGIPVHSGPAPLPSGFPFVYAIQPAVVLRVLKPGHPENLSPVTKCDVVLLEGRTVLRGVQVMRWGGASNRRIVHINPTRRDLGKGGASVTLTPANIEAQIRAVSRIEDLDGDQVAVGFVGGRGNAPVILGAFEHTRALLPASEFPVPFPTGGAPPAPAPAGDVEYLEHQGARVLINPQGDVVVDLTLAGVDNAGQPVGGRTPDAGSCYVNVGGASAIRLMAAGVPLLTLQIRPDGAVLELGAGGAQRLIMGETFLKAFNSHVHPGTAPPGGGAFTTSPPVDKVLEEAVLSPKARI